MSEDNLHLLVVGDEAHACLARMSQGAEVEGEDPLTTYASAAYNLGPIAGHLFKFNLHGFGSEPWANEYGKALEKLIPSLGGVALAGKMVEEVRLRALLPDGMAILKVEEDVVAAFKKLS